VLASAPAATSTAVDASPSLAITEVAGPSIPIADSTRLTEEHQAAAGVHSMDEITATTTAAHPEAEPAPALTVQPETHTDETETVAPIEAESQDASAVTPPSSDEPEKAQPLPPRGFFKKLFGRFGGK
jgi:hypothetical protein